MELQNIVLKSDDQLILIVHNDFQLYQLRNDYNALFMALNDAYEYTNIQFLELVDYIETHKNEL